MKLLISRESDDSELNLRLTSSGLVVTEIKGKVGECQTQELTFLSAPVITCLGDGSFDIVLSFDADGFAWAKWYPSDGAPGTEPTQSDGGTALVTALRAVAGTSLPKVNVSPGGGRGIIVALWFIPISAFVASTTTKAPCPGSSSSSSGPVAASGSSPGSPSLGGTTSGSPTSSGVPSSNSPSSITPSSNTPSSNSPAGGSSLSGQPSASSSSDRG